MNKELNFGTPLTLEQLRGMDGELVKIGDAHGNIAESAIVNAKTRFVVGKSGTLYLFEYYGKTWLAYSYLFAHIDREMWDDCPICKKYKAISFRGYRTREEAIDLSGKIHPHVSGGARFCPRCGKPRTPEAWAELEKRLRG